MHKGTEENPEMLEMSMPISELRLEPGIRKNESGVLIA
jgi:hypothetical protein